MQLSKLSLAGAATAALLFPIPAAIAAGTSPGLTSPASTGALVAPGGGLGTGSGFAAPTTHYGTTFGSWNLPAGFDDPGSASGTWFTGGTGGPPQFLMTATLDQTPIFPAPLSFVTGTLKGEVKPFPLSPFPAPWILLGNWSAATLTGEGSFEAYVATSGPIWTFAPIVLVGKVRGVFQDSLDPSSVGAHKGRWSLTY